MQQTFLGYVTTDLKFWAASTGAITFSLLVPIAALGVLFAWAFGPMAALYVLGAALGFALLDWCTLVVRMARRVALGLEDPNAFLDRSVVGNAMHLHRSYYVGPMPSLETVRG